MLLTVIIFSGALVSEKDNKTEFDTSHTYLGLAMYPHPSCSYGIAMPAGIEGQILLCSIKKRRIRAKYCPQRKTRALYVRDRKDEV